MHRLSRQEEIDRLVRLYGNEPTSRLYDLINSQFLILHNRAQVLLALCGVVITTTGFSGRLIAGTNALGQGMIIAGVGLTLVAALVVVLGVLHLHWLTQQPGDSLDAWLHSALAYRDRKTNWYRAGIVLLMLGLACYVVAIAIMLMYPGEFVAAGGR
ncbi:MAG: hypothetical protein WD042_05770 [Phycisphaeraceae bacterium]